ncbi:hypothetical protein G6F65_018465 [Rhizopus arrhizus]|nr:hypothetical protein G6F65_018465 [Rhizopus arrhizus]
MVLVWKPILPSLANTKASSNAPAVVISQPQIEAVPILARLDGNRNTPEPIMLPATRKVAPTTPIFYASAMTISCTGMSPVRPGVGTVALAYGRWRLLDEVVLQAALHPYRVAARAALLFQAAVQQLHAHRPRRRRAPDQVEHAVAALPERVGRQCRIPLQGQLAEDQVRAPQLGPVMGVAHEATMQVQCIQAAIGADHGIQPGAGQVGGVAT